LTGSSEGLEKAERGSAKADNFSGAKQTRRLLEGARKHAQKPERSTTTSRDTKI
jgi:hypothetical protein